MTHPSHDALWAWAQTGDEAPEPIGSHVESCAQCAATIADIRVAQQVLASLPPPPPMPEALAQRVGVTLAEKADRQFLAQWRRWWAGLLSPRWLVPIAAAVLAVLVLRGLPEDPAARLNPSSVAETATAPIPSPTETRPAPKELPEAPPPPSPAPKRLIASVAVARGAQDHERPLRRAQVLQEGARVATEAGGSLWMRLGDGTRAGLTGATQVTLARLEEKAVRLEVTQGNLAMVVPHREDRLVTVQAGDVEVKDLGTRFLVSRTEGRVLVAVEEGAVEVKTPTTSRKVVAGHAASWHDGRLDSLTWEVPPPRHPATQPPAGQATPPAPRGEEQKKASDEPDETRSVPEATPEDEEKTPDEPDDSAEGTGAAETALPATAPARADSTEEEWAKLPPRESPAPPATSTPRRSRFDLSGLEERLRTLQRALQAPFLPDEQLREARMKEVTFRAQAGECRGVLVSAERWLRQPSTRRAEEPMWRRSVLTEKWRCLLKLGRLDDAKRVQRELDAQP